MTDLLRSSIAFIASAIVVVTTAAWVGEAGAATSADHKAIVDTDIAQTGFLDLKTFMVVPMNEDGELGLASRQMRVISPETLWSREPRMDLLKSIKQDAASGGMAATPQRFSTPDFDTMPLRINGEPFTLSLGLREAILKDIETNIRTYGDPGIFSGGAGFVSASYLGAMTRDVIDRISQLESMANNLPASAPHERPAGQFFVSGPLYVIPAPPALPVFAVGLLALAWLRRRRRNAVRAAF